MLHLSFLSHKSQCASSSSTSTQRHLLALSPRCLPPSSWSFSSLRLPGLGVLWNVLLPFRLLFFFRLLFCSCCRTHPHCVPHCVLTSLGHLAGTSPATATATALSPSPICNPFSICRLVAAILMKLRHAASSAFELHAPWSNLRFLCSRI